LRRYDEGEEEDAEVEEVERWGSARLIKLTYNP
jgi:hypothetical protein